MKTKSFDDLIKTKLSQEQLDEIKKQAQLEVAILRSIQKILADTMAEYMKKIKLVLTKLFVVYLQVHLKQLRYNVGKQI